MGDQIIRSDFDVRMDGRQDLTDVAGIGRTESRPFICLDVFPKYNRFFPENLVKRPVEQEIVDLILECDDLKRRSGRKGCALGNDFDLLRHRIQPFACRRPDEEAGFRVLRNDIRGVSAVSDDPVNPDIAR